MPTLSSLPLPQLATGVEVDGRGNERFKVELSAPDLVETDTLQDREAHDREYLEFIIRVYLRGLAPE